MALSKKGFLMKRSLALLLAAALATLALPAFAAPPVPGEALALVPSDALAVGQIRFDRLKTSAASAGLMHETDAISSDGKASQFLRDAGLDPKKDVDTATLSLSSSDGKQAGPLAVFEGRFDPAALAAATVSRGGARVDAAPLPYYRLPAHAGETSHETGAVAFVSAHLVLAGTETALLHALDAYAAGSAGLPAHSFLSDALSRVDRQSAAWAVVDTARLQQLHPSSTRPGDGPAAQITSALRALSLVAFQANVSERVVSVSATGLAADEETRQNLEDMLRGLLAAWRMSAQEKEPDLVAAIRKIRVTRTDDGVTISGDIPVEAFHAPAKPIH
jgi:hypothetical protein